MGGSKKTPLPKMSRTYISMMKLGTVIYVLPKEDTKNILITWNSPWVLLTSAFFDRKLEILLYQKIQILIAFWYIISNSLNIFWVLKDVLINMVTILVMSTKMATLGFLKITMFLSMKSHQNFITWPDYIVDVVMWPKFGKKSKKVLGVNSFVFRCYRGKTGRKSVGAFCPPPPPPSPLIQNRVKLKLETQKYICICTTWKFKNVNLNSQWHNDFYFILI